MQRFRDVAVQTTEKHHSLEDSTYDRCRLIAQIIKQPTPRLEELRRETVDRIQPQKKVISPEEERPEGRRYQAHSARKALTLTVRPERCADRAANHSPERSRLPSLGFRCSGVFEAGVGGNFVLKVTVRKTWLISS